MSVIGTLNGRTAGVGWAGGEFPGGRGHRGDRAGSAGPAPHQEQSRYDLFFHLTRTSESRGGAAAAEALAEAEAAVEASAPPGALEAGRERPQTMRCTFEIGFTCRKWEGEFPDT